MAKDDARLTIALSSLIYVVVQEEKSGYLFCSEKSKLSGVSGNLCGRNLLTLRQISSIQSILDLCQFYMCKTVFSVFLTLSFYKILHKIVYFILTYCLSKIHVSLTYFVLTLCISVLGKKMRTVFRSQ